MSFETETTENKNTHSTDCLGHVACAHHNGEATATERRYSQFVVDLLKKVDFLNVQCVLCLSFTLFY